MAESMPVWAANVYEMDAARALLDHADSILSGRRLPEESTDPLLTVASIGAEKMLKMTLGVIETAEVGQWPSKKRMKAFGHDVTSLDAACRDLLRQRTHLAVHPGSFAEQLAAIDTDALVPPFVGVLARYAREGRFYYLDSLAETPQEAPAPRDMWNELEAEVREIDPEILPMIARPGGDFDAGVARTLKHIRDALSRWRNLYYMAWRSGVCGQPAREESSSLMPPSEA